MAFPVWNYQILPHAFKKYPFGGKDMTDLTITFLLEQGHTVSTEAEVAMIDDAKERFFQVRSKSTQGQNPPECITLPDGRRISFDSERYNVPETLFDASLLGSNPISIQAAARYVIEHCKLDMTRELHNVLCVGGNLGFRGFKERLQEELLAAGCTSRWVTE